MGFLARISKFVCLGTLYSLLCTPAWAVAPTVTNVQAHQWQDASRKVTIEYTLTDPDSETVYVSVAISNDGGSTYSITPASITGDIGRVRPGGRRTIIWDAKADYPTAVWSSCKAEVTACESAFIVDYFDTDSGLWDYVGTVANVDTGAKYPGSAYLDATNGCLVLTSNSDHQAGVIWLKQDIRAPCVVEFRYGAGGGSGADGLVFMFYKNRNYEPCDGGGLAFVTLPGPTAVAGYGIEFDNYDNGNQYGGDPSGNHIALLKDRVGDHLANRYDTRTEDNQWHTASVEIGTSSVSVRVDGELVIDWQGTIDRTYGGFGFGASTASFNNWHVIDNVRVSVVAGM